MATSFHADEVLIVEFESPVSLNKFYSSPSWHFRSAKKKEWRGMFEAQVREKYPHLVGRLFESATVYVEVHHNRMDIDNHIMTEKFLMDCLEKDLGVIKSDGPRHYKRLTIEYNDSLPKNSGRITVYLCQEPN